MTNLSGVWQTVTFAQVQLHQWRQASLVHRGLGWLRQWRQGSVLLVYGDAIALLLIALVFALAPFISTTLIGVLLLVNIAFWGLLTVTDEGQGWGFTPMHLLVTLYWAIATVATILSPVKAAAVSGWIKLTLYLLFYVLMARVLRSSRWRNWLIAIYLLTALVVSIYGLRQWQFGAVPLATWSDPTSASADLTRIYSYLGNPNLLAGYLVPAVSYSIAAIFVWKSPVQKGLAVGLAIAHAACLVFTYSRGGWLGFVGGGYVLMMLLVWWWSPRLPGQWRRWALPLVLGSSAAVIVVAVVGLEPLRVRVTSIFAGRGDSSNNFRINVWAGALAMVRDHPILGIGPGNDAFNQVYPLYQRPRFTALSAYSVPLELAVETGLIGLTCFVWLVLVTVQQGWHVLQDCRDRQDDQGYWLMAALASLAGLMTHGLVDTVWYRPQVNMLWWLSMAMVAGFYQYHRDRLGHGRALSHPPASDAVN